MQYSRRSVMARGSVGASLLAMSAACSRNDQKNASNLGDLDAVETASRIKSGELTAREATLAAINRAKAVEPKINAIATKTYKKALNDADGVVGPWAGVPTFIKDLDDVTGVKSSFGSRAFPGYKGKKQSDLVNSLLKMGVVSLGKSTTPEFGLTATTEPFNTGKTRNPWNTDYSTGGSSGGAAALVAARVVPIAHASDGGGSIRIPASCCGNIGLKVSRNRNPIARVESGPISLSVHGVQSRTVRDTAAVAHALEMSPSESGLAPIGLVSSASTRRLRIGLVDYSPNNRPIDPDIVESVRKTATVCEDLGHEIKAIKLPVNTQLENDFFLYWAFVAHSAVTFWEKKTKLPRNRLAFEPFTLGLVFDFEKKQDLFNGAVARLQGAAAGYPELFDNIDVILSPVLATPPIEIGFLKSSLDFDLLVERLSNYAQFTAFYNIVGAPAISLPLSMTQNGLPNGAMFGAAVGDEKTLLELSYELEAAMPWIGRLPSVVAQ